jgi:hypothetical protein
MVMLRSESSNLYYYGDVTEVVEIDKVRQGSIIVRIKLVDYVPYEAKVPITSIVYVSAKLKSRVYIENDFELLVNVIKVVGSDRADGEVILAEYVKVPHVPTLSEKSLNVKVVAVFPML